MTTKKSAHEWLRNPEVLATLCEQQGLPSTTHVADIILPARPDDVTMETPVTEVELFKFLDDCIILAVG